MLPSSMRSLAVSASPTAQLKVILPCIMQLARRLAVLAALQCMLTAPLISVTALGVDKGWVLTGCLSPSCQQTPTVTAGLIGIWHTGAMTGIIQNRNEAGASSLLNKHWEAAVQRRKRLCTANAEHFGCHAYLPWHPTYCSSTHPAYFISTC